MIPLIIIGLGRIGAGNVGLAGDLPLSHLSAALASGGFSIHGLVDPDATIRQALLDQYSQIDPACVVASLDEIPPVDQPMIVIATPPDSRLATAEQALALQPKLLVLEKPLALDFQTGQQLIDLSREAGVTLRVNYNRRFDRRHDSWRKAAPKVPRIVVTRYGKGLHNYASHMVDLLLHWYGPVAGVRAFSAGNSDHADPNLSFCCHMSADFDAIFLGIEELQYDQFEIDIFGEDERVELADGGVEIRHYRPQLDKHYNGYTQLKLDNHIDRAPVGGFAELYEAARKYCLDGKDMTGCDGLQALMNLAVLEAAARSFANGGTCETPTLSQYTN